MSVAIAAPPVPQELDRRRMNLIFGTVVLGLLISALDQTIVATALPTIVGDLGGAEHLSWMVSSYLLADTVATVLAGKFGDLFGRKLMLQVSAGVFVVASAACGLAGGMTWLIGWRAVQQLQLAIARLLGSRGRSALAEIRDASGTQLDVGNGWCVGAVHLRTRLGRDAGVDAIASRYRLPGPVLRPAFERARADGYLAGDDDHLRLTAAGQREIDGPTAAMHAWLAGQLQDWGAEDGQLLREAMGNVAREIVDQDPFRAPTPELATAAR